MANFIAVSGACTTGKTSIINSLSTYPESSKLIFSPDMHDVVWSDLVDKGFFEDFSDILSDSDYLCTYLIRLIDHYNSYLDSFEYSDSTVILDGCWLDLFIYSILNMWYTRVIKSIQEDILYRLSRYDDRISRIYLTKANDIAYPTDKFRLRGKISTFRSNRPLELRYYDLAKHFKDVVSLPTSDVDEASMFIIRDLKDLGYV